MAVLQSTYAASISALYAGMIVNQELHSSVTRIQGDATAIGFGVAVFAGATDNVITATRTLVGAGSEAASGNVGTSTITDVPTVTAAAKVGRYVITQLTTSATGELQVQDPAGVVVGSGVVGTQFTVDGITATVTSGGTATAGDVFYVDVTGNEFEGITIRDVTVEGATADTFPRYTNVPLCKLGVIAVTAAVAVNKNQKAYVTTAGAWTNVATGNIAIPGAVFDATISATGVVPVRIK